MRRTVAGRELARWCGQSVSHERGMSMRAPLACTALLALLLAGCGDAGGFAADEWGPLAVVDAAGPGDDAVISGTIRIDGGCVSLEAADGARTLLVWPRGGTAWTGEAIEFWAGGSESWTTGGRSAHLRRRRVPHRGGRARRGGIPGGCRLDRRPRPGLRDRVPVVRRRHRRGLTTFHAGGRGPPPAIGRTRVARRAYAGLHGAESVPISIGPNPAPTARGCEAGPTSVTEVQR